MRAVVTVTFGVCKFSETVIALNSVTRKRLVETVTN
jgi:hypothetical protein